MRGSVMKTIGFALIIVGMIVAAGSGNDCDGRCMEQANDLGTTLVVAAAGLLAMLIGVLAVFNAERI